MKKRQAKASSKLSETKTLSEKYINKQQRRSTQSLQNKLCVVGRFAFPNRPTACGRSGCTNIEGRSTGLEAGEGELEVPQTKVEGDKRALEAGQL